MANGSRWRGRLFPFTSAVSMLLFVVVCGMWLRSYRSSFGIAWYEVIKATGWGRTDVYGVTSGRFLAWTSASHTANVNWDVPPQWNRIDGANAPSLFRVQFRADAFWFLGFAYDRGHSVNALAPNDFYRQLAVPCWQPALLFALLPARWVREEYRRRRKPTAGLCPVCGYDLRATPQRCPECGAGSAAC